MEKCEERLTKEEYKKFFKKTKSENSFFEQIFSLKNQKKFGIKIKVMTIWGIPIELKARTKKS